MNHSNLPNAPTSMNHGNLQPHVNVNHTVPTTPSMQMAAMQAYRRRNLRQVRTENERLERAERLRQSQQPSGVSKASTSGRSLRSTSAQTKRAGPAKVADAEQLRAPNNFPPEIVLNILRHLLVREGEKTVFLRPKKSLDQSYLTHSSIDSPTATRPDVYNDQSDEQPPMEKHTSPSTNLLLVSKVFRDEGYNFFYRHNVFSFANNDHADDVFRRLDRQKRNLIRHVAFESQWGLQLSLNSDMSRKIATEFDVEWGNYLTSALDDLPNIKSITLRVRCTTHYTEFLHRWGAFEWDLNDSSKVWIQHDKDVLGFLETRDEMRAWVANKIEADYTALGKERFLPMIKLAFVWRNETREWKGAERLWSLAGIERDRAKFGDDRDKEKTEEHNRLALATAVTL
jgi:hypothetical protein